MSYALTRHREQSAAISPCPRNEAFDVQYNILRLFIRTSKIPEPKRSGVGVFDAASATSSIYSLHSPQTQAVTTS